MGVRKTGASTNSWWGGGASLVVGVHIFTLISQWGQGKELEGRNFRELKTCKFLPTSFFSYTTDKTTVSTF